MIKLINYKSLMPLISILLFMLLTISPIVAETNELKLLIYNAASTSDVIKEIAEEWENSNTSKIRTSSASSSSLAKQIINGAPANIYISASSLWIEELINKKIVLKQSIKPIFENKLVLITHINSTIKNIGIIKNKTTLESLFNENLMNSRISIADPTHVPAGVYTKQALKKLGLWKNLNTKNMAWGGDVRRTLKFVALGNSPLGIVYYTDAIAEKNVKIIGNFSIELHSPIQYWVAAIKKNTTQTTMQFLSFLENSYSKSVYLKHGFTTVKGK